MAGSSARPGRRPVPPVRGRGRDLTSWPLPGLASDRQLRILTRRAGMGSAARCCRRLRIRPAAAFGGGSRSAPRHQPRSCTAGQPKAPGLRDLGAVSDGRDRRLDGVGRSRVHPVLGRVVAEREPLVQVVGDLRCGLGELAAVASPERCCGVAAVLGVPDLREGFFAPDARTSAAPSAHEAPGAVPQQVRPRIGRLAVALSQRDDLLAPVHAHADHHQQAPLVPLDPDIDVAGWRVCLSWCWRLRMVST